MTEKFQQPQPKKLLAVVEPGDVSEMTDSELDAFADSLFDKIRERRDEGE